MNESVYCQGIPYFEYIEQIMELAGLAIGSGIIQIQFRKSRLEVELENAAEAAKPNKRNSKYLKARVIKSERVPSTS
ncbi:MAG: hypothetical protein WBQ25_11640 [Nitrososphaeraceae archaeon]